MKSNKDIILVFYIYIQSKKLQVLDMNDYTLYSADIYHHKHKNENIVS
jgi:hypothetical protein